MKILSNKFLRCIILILLLQFSIGPEVSGQTPPPPPPPNGGPTNGHGLGGNQGAEDAPAGNGLVIVLLFAVLYAGMKYNIEAKKEELPEN